MDRVQFARRPRLVVLIVLASTLHACGQSASEPYIQRQDIVPFGLGGIVGFSVAQEYPPTLIRGYTVPGGPRYTMLKGVFGEFTMDRVLQTEFLSGTGRWAAVNPGRVGQAGIDGLYIKCNSRGNPTGLLVGEAKYGSSTLSLTKDGRQMEATWRRPRLANAARAHREFAARLRRGSVTIVEGTPSSARSYFRLPLANGQEVLWDSSMSRAYSSMATGADDIARQAELIGDYLTGAAEGRFEYRSRVFRYKYVRGEVRITSIDADTGLRTGDPISRPFKALSAEMQDLLAQSAEDAIARELSRVDPRLGYALSQERARALVQEARKAGRLPELIEDSRPTYRWSPKLGLVASTRSGLLGMILAGPADLITQGLTESEINWSRTGAFTGLGFSGGLLGTWTGTEIQYIANLPRTQVLLARIGAKTFGRSIGIGGARVAGSVAGGLGGGLVASAVFSYGAYFAGYMDLQEANRGMIAGSIGSAAGVGAYFGSLGLVGAFATASTGTPIATLSGAAAGNATMAWLGGGSIAAGGGGMATGAVVLATGVGCVVLATTAVVYIYYSLEDAELERRRIEALLEANRELLSKPG